MEPRFWLLYDAICHDLSPNPAATNTIYTPQVLNPNSAATAHSSTSHILHSSSWSTNGNLIPNTTTAMSSSTKVSSRSRSTFYHRCLSMHAGHKYQIVQPHRSQSDWTPPITPALWTRLPEEYVGPSPGYQSPPAQQPQQPQQAPPPGDHLSLKDDHVRLF